MKAPTGFDRDYLVYLPGNAEVRVELESLEGGTDRPKVKRLIKECIELGAAPHLALECIAPLVWEIRPATCSFQGRLQGLAPRPSSKDSTRRALISLAREVFRRFGIRTAFLRYGSLGAGTGWGVAGKVYFSRNPALCDEVSEIERLAWSEMEGCSGGGGHPLESVEREGRLLGYPACCVHWACETQRAGKSLEDLASSALIAEELACSFDRAKALPPELAYFAHEFYPCAPRCPAAEQVGKAVLWRYAREDAVLSALYQNDMFSLNKQCARKCFASYEDFVRPFNVMVCSELDIPLPGTQPEPGG